MLTSQRKRRRAALAGGKLPVVPNAPAAGGLTVADLSKELDTYSAAISTQVRTINLGVLGLTWLLLLRDQTLARLSNAIPDGALLGVSAACIVALVLDLAQYLLAEKAVKDAFEEAVAKNEVSEGYDEDSWAYQGQDWCYRAKLLVTFGAAATFVLLVVMAIL